MMWPGSFNQPTKYYTAAWDDNDDLYIGIYYHIEGNWYLPGMHATRDLLIASVLKNGIVTEEDVVTALDAVDSDEADGRSYIVGKGYVDK